MPAVVTPKERVLAAALDEFARHGVAGARVRPDPRAAKTSKERVYAYFRSKEELYTAVAAEQLQRVMDSATLDPADLPGYVGESSPEITWNSESRCMKRSFSSSSSSRNSMLVVERLP